MTPWYDAQLYATFSAWESAPSQCIAPTLYAANRRCRCSVDPSMAYIYQQKAESLSPGPERDAVIRIMILNLCCSFGTHREKIESNTNNVLTNLVAQYAKQIRAQTFGAMRVKLCPTSPSPLPPLPQPPAVPIPQRPTFVPYIAISGPWKMPVTVREELLTDLEPKFVATGQVYCASWPGSPDFVKIGYTGNSAAARVAGQRECFADMSLQGAYHFAYPEKIERLVHHELYHQRHKIAVCDVCGHGHIEWFKISALDAMQVVLDWYKLTQLPLYGENGKLLPEWQSRLTGVVGDVTARKLLETLDAQQLAARKIAPLLNVKTEITPSIAVAKILKEISILEDTLKETRKSLDPSQDNALLNVNSDSKPVIKEVASIFGLPSTTRSASNALPSTPCKNQTPVLYDKPEKARPLFGTTSDNTPTIKNVSSPDLAVTIHPFARPMSNTSSFVSAGTTDQAITKSPFGPSTLSASGLFSVESSSQQKISNQGLFGSQVTSTRTTSTSTLGTFGSAASPVTTSKPNSSVFGNGLFGVSVSSERKTSGQGLFGSSEFGTGMTAGSAFGSSQATGMQSGKSWSFGKAPGTTAINNTSSIGPSVSKSLFETNSQSSNLGGIFGRSPSGGSAFGLPPPIKVITTSGDASERFAPTVDKEIYGAKISYQSITFQQPYQKFSFEELQLADYNAINEPGKNAGQALSSVRGDSLSTVETNKTCTSLVSTSAPSEISCQTSGTVFQSTLCEASPAQKLPEVAAPSPTFSDDSFCRDDTDSAVPSSVSSPLAAKSQQTAISVSDLSKRLQSPELHEKGSDSVFESVLSSTPLKTLQSSLPISPPLTVDRGKSSSSSQVDPSENTSISNAVSDKNIKQEAQHVTSQSSALLSTPTKSATNVLLITPPVSTNKSDSEVTSASAFDHDQSDVAHTSTMDPPKLVLSHEDLSTDTFENSKDKQADSVVNVQVQVNDRGQEVVQPSRTDIVSPRGSDEQQGFPLTQKPSLIVQEPDPEQNLPSSFEKSSDILCQPKKQADGDAGSIQDDENPTKPTTATEPPSPGHKEGQRMLEENQPTKNLAEPVEITGHVTQNTNTVADPDNQTEHTNLSNNDCSLDATGATTDAKQNLELVPTVTLISPPAVAMLKDIKNEAILLQDDRQHNEKITPPRIGQQASIASNDVMSPMVQIDSIALEKSKAEASHPTSSISTRYTRHRIVGHGKNMKHKRSKASTPCLNFNVSGSITGTRKTKMTIRSTIEFG